jgi:lysozyme
MLEGPDVSRHNGGQPWAAMRPGFAIARASYGTASDVAARPHLTAAHGAGVELLGAYHYLRADVSAAEQAHVFLAAVDELEAALGVELALAVDVENLPAPAPPWGPRAYRASLVTFLALMPRPCAVYIAPSYAGLLALPAGLAAAPLWVAHWNVDKPTVPAPWTSWALWQTGIRGGLDRNTFAGGADDWRRTFGLGPLTRAAALARALGEVGTTEANEARIQEYLRDCQRGGVPLNLPAGSDWCAAFACWSGSIKPKRCAVWELVEDAREAGVLRAVGEYWPSPGDLAVYGRAGESPLQKWGRGHIGRVVQAREMNLTDVSGNSGPGADQVAVMTRDLSTVLAWIEVAR